MDYEAVIDEPLVFNPGITRVCHDIIILQDDICESDPNEFFFSNLTLSSGMQPIIVFPPSAEVIIDDTAEPECKSYIHIYRIQCIFKCLTTVNGYVILIVQYIYIYIYIYIYLYPVAMLFLGAINVILHPLLIFFLPWACIL